MASSKVTKMIYLANSLDRFIRFYDTCESWDSVFRILSIKHVVEIITNIKHLVRFVINVWQSVWLKL